MDVNEHKKSIILQLENRAVDIRGTVPIDFLGQKSMSLGQIFTM
jgi:hypothetical protein